MTSFGKPASSSSYCHRKASTGRKSRRRPDKLKFNLLVYTDNQVWKSYGVVYTFHDDLKNVYLKAFKTDIQAINEADVWQLPIPARFIIDGSGVIRDAKADPDYRYRPEPAEVLDIVKKLEVAKPRKAPGAKFA